MNLTIVKCYCTYSGISRVNNTFNEFRNQFSLRALSGSKKYIMAVVASVLRDYDQKITKIQIALDKTSPFEKYLKKKSPSNFHLHGLNEGFTDEEIVKYTKWSYMREHHDRWIVSKTFGLQDTIGWFLKLSLQQQYALRVNDLINSASYRDRTAIFNLVYLLTTQKYKNIEITLNFVKTSLNIEVSRYEIWLVVLFSLIKLFKNARPICLAHNQNVCKFENNCKYRHVCILCDITTGEKCQRCEHGPCLGRHQMTEFFSSASVLHPSLRIGSKPTAINPTSTDLENFYLICDAVEHHPDYRLFLEYFPNGSPLNDLWI